MSAGGLIAQAFLGGAERVGQGIGDRIREEAKLKRQQALEGTRTTETMKQQAHVSSLKRGENEQRQTMEMEQIGARDENARGRINLTDEVGRRNYEDVTDENGNIIGQRQTESNKFSPFATDSSSSAYNGLSKEDWTRLKYAHGVKNDRLKDLQEMSRDPMIEVDEKMTTEMAALNIEVQDLESLIFGGGGGGPSMLDDLLNGAGGDGSETGDPVPAQEPAPESIGGLVGGAMKTGEKQSRVTVATDQINGLQDEADKLLQRIKKPSVMGSIGKPGSQPQVDSDAIEAAQDLVQRLLALEDDPAMAEALTPRLRNNIKQRIMDIQRAGVPLNLNQ
jgi:hypothetical protein